MLEIKTESKFIGMLIFSAVFTFASFYAVSKPYQKTAAPLNTAAPAQPKVLGAAISLRGADDTSKITLPDLVKIKEPDTGKINARSWLVYDLDTGQTLSGKNEKLDLPIASLTKLITGLTAYDSINFGEQITISKKDLFNVNPSLNFTEGETIKINSLFDSAIIGSANDAALALANHAGQAAGKPFVDLMNEKAQNLGMASTHFSNPMGFDSKYNFSSANDLRLAVSASQKLLLFANLGRRTSYSFQNSEGKTYKISATNKLLASHPEMEAIKTGFTENSKGSIIAKVNWKGRKIIFIVLSSENREMDMENLENEIISAYGLN